MNRTIIIEERDLVHFVRDREAAAQIKVLRDIKPFGNGSRIQAMINSIKDGSYGNKKRRQQPNRKKNTAPREFVMTLRNVHIEEDDDYSNIEQYLVK